MPRPALMLHEKSRTELDPPSERALASLWANAHNLPGGLVAEDGRRFHVVYAGRPNPRAGPDFLDAVLETQTGELIRGDVELHLSAPDWYAHHHDLDPNYNGVVVHVVLYSKGRVATTQRSGVQAPVVSLSTHLEGLSVPAASPSRNLAGLAAMDGDSLGMALDRAGHERFIAKAQGFVVELDREAPEEVLYAAIMEALGYASNRRAFRRLARLVPMRLLSGLRSEPGSTRPLAINALLMGASGLDSASGSDDRSREVRQSLAKILPKTGRMGVDEWDLFRVRPANHPAARIEGAARLIDRHVDTGLVRGLEDALVGDGPKALTERIWAPPYIGESRARDIVVNAVLPFMRAYAGAKRSDALGARCLELYRKFPKLHENEITREAMRLFEVRAKGVDVRTAARQQGLIHLYRSAIRPATHTGSRRFNL